MFTNMSSMKAAIATKLDEIFKDAHEANFSAQLVKLVQEYNKLPEADTDKFGSREALLEWISTLDEEGAMATNVLVMIGMALVLDVVRSMPASESEDRHVAN